MTPLIFGNVGAGEVLIIGAVILLLFGGKKIPELMRGLGKGYRSFKEGMSGIEKELDEIKEDIEKVDEKPADKQ